VVFLKSKLAESCEISVTGLDTQKPAVFQAVYVRGKDPERNGGLCVRSSHIINSVDEFQCELIYVVVSLI